MFSKLAVDTFENSFSYDKETDLISVQPTVEFKNSLNKFSNNLFDETFPWSNKIFIAGGSMNLLLDENITRRSEIEKLSDIDIYVYGSETRKTVESLLSYFNSKCLKDYIYVGYRGSVIFVWCYSIGRMIQLVIMGENYKNINAVISDFDMDHIKIAYDGYYIYYKKDAIKAMQTKRVNYKLKYKSGKKNIPLRVFKADMREYMVYDENNKLLNNSFNKQDYDINSLIDKYRYTKYPLSKSFNEQQLITKFELTNCINLTKSYLQIGLQKENLKLNKLLNEVNWNGFNSMDDDAYYGLLDNMNVERIFDVEHYQQVFNRHDNKVFYKVDLRSFYKKTEFVILKNALLKIPFVDITFDDCKITENQIYIQFNKEIILKTEDLLNKLFNNKLGKIVIEFETFNKIKVETIDKNEAIENIKSSVQRNGLYINLLPIFNKELNTYHFKFANNLKQNKPLQSIDEEKFNKYYYSIIKPKINLLDNMNVEFIVLKKDNYELLTDCYIEINLGIHFKSIIKNEFYIYNFNDIDIKKLEKIFNSSNISINPKIEYDNSDKEFINKLFEIYNSEINNRTKVHYIPIFDRKTNILNLRLVISEDYLNKLVNLQEETKNNKSESKSIDILDEESSDDELLLEDEEDYEIDLPDTPRPKTIVKKVVKK